ncbi:IDEAL domain-containing protein [Thermicanus aegyptius]|uniref:IDEAL domain-containing protein n=1 Tax=Thermicanus aegyptius TaxID=94009 RepID=UPI00048D6B6C|nr:IDEAL domain-containing protein [Thermicanus aegyptius]
MEKQNVVPNQLYSLMAELVLDHAVREYEIRRLYEEIDLSLARRDKKRFMKLTEELKMILEDK